MSTTGNNKLIAEFLGWHSRKINVTASRPKGDGIELYLKEVTEYNREFEEDNLKFHTDWNWLMEVVEKIEGLKTPITNNPNLLNKFIDYEFHIQDKHIKIYAHGEVTKEIVCLSSSESKSKIDAVYNACVEFIKWYNKQSK